MKEVSLPSRAILKITLSPFSISKALFQAILKELKTIQFDPKMEDYILYKDIFCSGFSSKEIESCLFECMKRCTYNGIKIDENTFEKEESREDYLKVCVEVARENTLPFVKSLWSEFQNVSKMMTEGFQK